MYIGYLIKKSYLQKKYIREDKKIINKNKNGIIIIIKTNEKRRKRKKKKKKWKRI